MDGKGQFHQGKSDWGGSMRVGNDIVGSISVLGHRYAKAGHSYIQASQYDQCHICVVLLHLRLLELRVEEVEE